MTEGIQSGTTAGTVPQSVPSNRASELPPWCPTPHGAPASRGQAVGRLAVGATRLQRIGAYLADLSEDLHGRPAPRRHAEAGPAAQGPSWVAQLTTTVADARQRASAAVAVALAPISGNDERLSFALLTLPILALIVGFGTVEAMKPCRRSGGGLLLPPLAGVTIARPPAIELARPVGEPARTDRAAGIAVVAKSTAAANPATITARPTTVLAARAASDAVTENPRTVAPIASRPPPAGTAPPTLVQPVPPIHLALPLMAAAPSTTLAVPGPVAGDARRDRSLDLDGPFPPAAIADAPLHPRIPADVIAGIDVYGPGEKPAICEAAPGLFASDKERSDPARLPPIPAAANFGAALALAARRQLDDLVIYNDRYRRISNPMGDVSPLYGVCTDVLIRAYRAVGIDLQKRVHEAKVGTGDPNIDHRRTEVLRLYFARNGESLPFSSIAEDYRPGDIVTYYRPQNTSARSHIALVSDVLAPSGRYMIIHNRGWGPQLEDALFVDEITGHYRYTGEPPVGRPAKPQAPNEAEAIVAIGAPASGALPLPNTAIRAAASNGRGACPTPSGQRTRGACGPRATRTSAARSSGAIRR